MKRFILSLLFLALTTLTMQAQFRLTYENQEYPAGSTFTYYAEDDPFGDGNIEVKAIEPFIHNDGTKDVTTQVSYTPQIDQCTAEGGTFSLCFGGSCTTDSKAVGLIKAGTAASASLDAFFVQGQYGTLLAYVSVTQKGGLIGSPTTNYYAKFVYSDPAGITDLNAAAPAFALEGRNLRYDFATAAPRSLAVYGLDGRCALRQSLSATAGNVGLDNLAEGVYVVTAMQGGKALYSEKVVLR